MNENVMT